MRPTCRHSSISPQCGLYALPSLCALSPRLGDPRVDPCFLWHTFSTCRPPGTDGKFIRLLIPSSFTDDAGLRPEGKRSRHFQLPHPPILVGGSFFEASLRFTFAATCRFACSPVGADRVFTQPTRAFTFGLPTD